MSEWLASRQPAPPEALGRALGELLYEGAVPYASRAAGPERGAATVGALAAAARERLDRALARTGRARESAFRLLEADALFTYACEAALDAEDPVGALRRILDVAVR